MIYQLIISEDSYGDYILCVSNGKLIPKDPANTDYAKFKKDLADGAELQDSEGVVMTAEQVNQFIETLA
jgi:hypothetical protein